MDQNKIIFGNLPPAFRLFIDREYDSLFNLMMRCFYSTFQDIARTAIRA
ncbi:hypothetical protein SAMN05421863_103929 [Nitrosomonas communis]|uniref:Uncharacterized protein n=1 Tax=Nitrosomonas communis TaxID=44574 RepID=A0A1I4SC56_9PROT|nr:hypothetical protein SAMN05421863_103929 [Nitrosomonas communis]